MGRLQIFQNIKAAYSSQVILEKDLQVSINLY